MALSEQVQTRKLKAGETLFSAGEDGSTAYLVRIGNIALNREGGRQILSQHYAGELVGQMAVMGSPTRRDDAVAVVRSEVIEIPREVFLELAGSSSATVGLQQGLKSTLVGSTQLAARPEAGRAIGFLMQEGYGEATNALVIDDALCVGCDNCERACADTHDGISRLDRAAGPSKAGLHIPTSCRHCEIPHCMKDVPMPFDALLTERCISPMRALVAVTVKLTAPMTRSHYATRHPKVLPVCGSFSAEGPDPAISGASNPLTPAIRRGP